MAKTKIVLDADVVIHFAKGGWLSKLPDIFPEYEYVVFAPTKEMRKEYAILSNRFGRDESACMTFCKFSHDVVGSSNLKDIRCYCEENRITYLTTLDFLHYAIQRGVMTHEEANGFVAEVIAKGSILPSVDFYTYVSKVVL